MPVKKGNVGLEWVCVCCSFLLGVCGSGVKRVWEESCSSHGSRLVVKELLPLKQDWGNLLGPRKEKGLCSGEPHEHQRDLTHLLHLVLSLHYMPDVVQVLEIHNT